MHFCVADCRAAGGRGVYKTAIRALHGHAQRHGGRRASSRRSATAATPARRSCTRSLRWIWCAPASPPTASRRRRTLEGAIRPAAHDVACIPSVAQVRTVPAGTDHQLRQALHDTARDTPRRRPAHRLCRRPEPPADRNRSSFLSAREAGSRYRHGSAWTCACWTSRKFRMRSPAISSRIFGYDDDGTLVPCERLAAAQGTINYELLCQISKRIPRICHRGAETSQILQYIV